MINTRANAEGVASLGVYVPFSFKARVVEAAHAEQMTVSDVIRQALSQWVDQRADAPVAHSS